MLILTSSIHRWVQAQADSRWIQIRLQSARVASPPPPLSEAILIIHKGIASPFATMDFWGTKRSNTNPTIGIWEYVANTPQPTTTPKPTPSPTPHPSTPQPTTTPKPTTQPSTPQPTTSPKPTTQPTNIPTTSPTPSPRPTNSTSTPQPTTQPTSTPKPSTNSTAQPTAQPDGSTTSPSSIQSSASRAAAWLFAASVMLLFI